MAVTRNVNLYSTLSETSKILNCILLYNKKVGDVTIEVEQNKISVQGKDFHKVFILRDLYLYPDTCRGLKCLPHGEIHFSLKAESTMCRRAKTDEYETSYSHVTASQMRLSQNDLVDKIELLQNKWYCAICQQKLLADRCILSRVLPLPSENWSDFADMWFCHKPEGEQPIRKQRFLPRPGECFVGETYLLVNGTHVKTGAVKMTKDGTLSCVRCGKQLGVVMQTQTDNSTNSETYKFYLHTIKIQHDMPDIEVHKSVSDRLNTELFFSRLLQEQCQLYTNYRFIVETSHKNGYKDSMPGNDVSTCLVWLLDTDVMVYKSGDTEGTEQTIEKHHIIKILFKCQLNPSNDKRPTDYVTKSLISMWRKDNTVHSINLPHPVFLQFIQTLVQNCKTLCSTQRYLNGFYVSTQCFSELPFQGSDSSEMNMFLLIRSLIQPHGSRADFVDMLRTGINLTELPALV